MSSTPHIIMLPAELSEATRPVIETLLHEHLPGAGQDLILDLSPVRFIDSAGLQMLLGCREALMRTGATLALAGLQPEPALIFTLLDAGHAFPRFATVRDALSARPANARA